MGKIHKKYIALLGSTGSVGRQTLEVIDLNRDAFQLMLLSAYSQIELLAEQCSLFKPRYAIVLNESLKVEALELFRSLDTELLVGFDALQELIQTLHPLDLVVNAISGFDGLIPSVETIKRSCTLALANKESLVSAGEILVKMSKEYNSLIIPVDSELAAIKQCLEGEQIENVENLYLTASGGPFREYSPDKFKDITPEQALKHPIWNMGQKISIDSATLMNKAMEMIAAKWLFGVDSERIRVLVHPQAIVHALVEYTDGNTKAVLAKPDMKTTISYALFYPKRVKNKEKGLDFLTQQNLTFSNPNAELYPSVNMANKALNLLGNIPAALNASNEVAVGAFLRKKISFFAIFEIVQECMNKITYIADPTLAQIIDTHNEISIWAKMLIEKTDYK